MPTARTHLKAVIFDCFGVLYVDYSEAYFAGFPQLRGQLRDLNNACDRGFLSLEEYLEAVSKMTGDPPEVIDKAFSREHVLNHRATGYIQNELRPAYKIGLLTNIGRGWMQQFFNEHQLHELFDAVVISSEEGVIKPEAEIYRRTAERLGVATNECIMIDDREENCAGAEAAGMVSVWYDSFEQMKRELSRLLQ